MTAITASALTKRYGHVLAVDGLSFDIQPGEIVGFLGPNGAGKTTTLRMLAGLVRPTRGRCQMLGRRVPGPSLLEVGTMIEEPSFYPYLSGRANLHHAAVLHGGVPERRVDEVLEFMRMELAAEKRVRAYSQGMRQRLALARALLWKPKVLLLDEPTNGLDPAGIAEVRAALKTVAMQGVTVLISSHILPEIEKLVERILAVDKGSLRFDGPLQGLLGAAGANTVSYELEATDGRALLDALADLGLKPTPHGDAGARVAVPAALATDLLSGLATRGVDVLEARRGAASLEDAYLRLVGAEGRPS
ncbi:MAG TPA: ABC transporter ATP-binding protein [Trueperaceae bacterium]|nr:ABC transporter ATP-binding protein [Trueperaceae bacterium]